MKATLKPRGSRDWLIEKAIKEGMRFDRWGQLVLPSGAVYKGNCPKVGKRYRMVTFRDESGKAHALTYARVSCWLLYGAPPDPSYEADHINRKKWDDRPENLRWVTRSQNAANISEATRDKYRDNGRQVHADYLEYKRKAELLDEAKTVIQGLVDKVALWPEGANPEFLPIMKQARKLLADMEG